MKHGKLQKYVLEYLSQFTSTKFNVITANRRGIADIVCCIKGRFIAIEVKVGKDKLRPSQITFLQGVINDGGIGLVVHEKHYEAFCRFILDLNKNPQLHNGYTYDVLKPPLEAKAKSFDF